MLKFYFKHYENCPTFATLNFRGRICTACNPGQKNAKDMNYLFTSESVSEGHPDKVADQISDAILDEFLRRDPESRVACETFCSTGLVIVGGEVRADTYVDIQGFQKSTNRARTSTAECLGRIPTTREPVTRA